MRLMIVLRGLPCSGKTWLAKRLPFPRVHYDILRKRMFPDPDYSYQESMQVRDEAASIVESLFEHFDVVVVDGTNLTYNARAFWRHVAVHRIGAGPVFVWLDPPVAEFLEQIEHRKVPRGKPDNYWIKYVDLLNHNCERGHMGLALRSRIEVLEFIKLTKVVAQRY